MKKFLLNILIMVCLFSMSSMVLAQNNASDFINSNMQPLYIPEGKATVQIPEGWNLVTKDTKADDPQFENLGGDLEIINLLLIEKDSETLLYARNPKGIGTITISLHGDEESESKIDMRLNDSKEYKLLDDFSMFNGKPDTDIYDAEPIKVITTSQGRFFVLSKRLKNPKIKTHSIRIATIVDGKHFTFDFIDYYDEKNASKIEEILKTIKFDESVHKAYENAVKQKKPLAKLFKNDSFLKIGIIIIVAVVIIGLIVFFLYKRNTYGYY